MAFHLNWSTSTLIMTQAQVYHNKFFFVLECVLWLNCISGHNRHCFLGLALTELCVGPIGSLAIGECRNKLHEIPQPPAENFSLSSTARLQNLTAAVPPASTSLPGWSQYQLRWISLIKTGSQKYPTAGNTQNYDKLLQGKKSLFQKCSYSPNLCVTVNSSLQGECRVFG